MTDLRTAAQQALEALEADDSKLWPSDKRIAAITALRAALAEPVQEPDVPETNFGNMEPVAWLWQHRETGRTRVLMPDERTATDVAAAWDVVGPLYLAPPQRKPPATIDEMFDRMDKAPKGVFFGHDPMTIWMEAWRAAEQQHGIT